MFFLWKICNILDFWLYDIEICVIVCENNGGK